LLGRQVRQANGQPAAYPALRGGITLELDLAATGGSVVPTDADASDGLDIVYTVSDQSNYALFAERDTAKRAAQIWRAVMRSTTWGEFKKTMPVDLWEDVVEPLGEDVPSDNAPFSSDDVPGWGNDGYYPGPWLPEAAVDWFPEDLIDKYGVAVLATPNGLELWVPTEAADQVAAELRARGHTVEKSIDDLPEWISYVYGY
jgi:hypothetical protein